MARILLVEDDPEVRLVIEHVLVDDGYEVDAVGDVKTGSDLLAGNVYDLLVTDGRLPDGTGLELADEAARLGIQTVIITGYAFILRELAASSEKYNILLKPLRPIEILESVRTALNAATRATE